MSILHRLFRIGANDLENIAREAPDFKSAAFKWEEYLQRYGRRAAERIKPDIKDSLCQKAYEMISNPVQIIDAEKHFLESYAELELSDMIPVEEVACEAAERAVLPFLEHARAYESIVRGIPQSRGEMPLAFRSYIESDELAGCVLSAQMIASIFAYTDSHKEEAVEAVSTYLTVLVQNADAKMNHDIRKIEDNVLLSLEKRIMSRVASAMNYRKMLKNIDEFYSTIIDTGLYFNEQAISQFEVFDLNADEYFEQQRLIVPKAMAAYSRIMVEEPLKSWNPDDGTDEVKNVFYSVNIIREIAREYDMPPPPQIEMCETELREMTGQDKTKTKQAPNI